MKKIFFVAILLLAAESASADTLFFKKGGTAKGLIVDEYADRFLVNTESGKKEFLKRDVKKVQYDTAEQNLMNLGSAREEKEDYQSALYYYRRAAALNPSMRSSRDAIERCQGKALANYSEVSKEAVEEREVVEDARTRGVEAAVTAKELVAKISSSTGLELAKKGDYVVVQAIWADSEVHQKGIRSSDRLVSAWGEPLRYGDFYKILKDIDGPKDSILKLTFEKDIELSKKETILLGLRLEGLFVKKSSNPALTSGDLLLKIKDQDAQYLNEKKAALLLKESKNYPMMVTVQRTVYITRK